MNNGSEEQSYSALIMNPSPLTSPVTTHTPCYVWSVSKSYYRELANRECIDN